MASKWLKPDVVLGIASLAISGAVSIADAYNRLDERLVRESIPKKGRKEAIRIFESALGAWRAANEYKKKEKVKTDAVHVSGPSERDLQKGE